MLSVPGHNLIVRGRHLSNNAYRPLTHARTRHYW